VAAVGLAAVPAAKSELTRRISRAIDPQGWQMANVAGYLESLPRAEASAVPRAPIAGGPLRPHPANRRYFAGADGRVVLLTGSHTWLNLQDGGASDPPPPFDYATWLRFLERHDHNFFRLWVWEQAKWTVEKGPLHYAPLPYRRTGPGLAFDGEPKFDLTQYDDAYFQRLRDRVAAAGERGIYVAVMLFNGWSVAYPKGSHRLQNPWHGHPYNRNNNVNGIDGDPNRDDSGIETHELINPRILRLQEAYVRKVVDTVNDLDNVLYEISNESHVNSVRWQHHMIDFIQAYERTLPKQHPVGMTVAFPKGSNDDLFESNADWISPRGALETPDVADGRKVILLDTDHVCGICGDRKWAWKSFLRGHNPLFMDRYDDGYGLDGGGYDLNKPRDKSLRLNLGFIRRYASRIDLAAMAPRGDLASTGYALAGKEEYLIYLPDGGEATVDLTSVAGPLRVEWFDPATGTVRGGPEAAGGARQAFAAPFRDDAVLYLRRP
jgi:hypothetical protein